MPQHVRQPRNRWPRRIVGGLVLVVVCLLLLAMFATSLATIAGKQALEQAGLPAEFTIASLGFASVKAEGVLLGSLSVQQVDAHFSITERKVTDLRLVGLAVELHVDEHGHVTVPGLVLPASDSSDDRPIRFNALPETLSATGRVRFTLPGDRTVLGAIELQMTCDGDQLRIQGQLQGPAGALSLEGQLAESGDGSIAADFLDVDLERWSELLPVAVQGKLQAKASAELTAWELAAASVALLPNRLTVHHPEALVALSLRGGTILPLARQGELELIVDRLAHESVHAEGVSLRIRASEHAAEIQLDGGRIALPQGTWLPRDVQLALTWKDTLSMTLNEFRLQEYPLVLRNVVCREMQELTAELELLVSELPLLAPVEPPLLSASLSADLIGRTAALQMPMQSISLQTEQGNVAGSASWQAQANWAPAMFELSEQLQLEDLRATIGAANLALANAVCTGHACWPSILPAGLPEEAGLTLSVTGAALEQAAVDEAMLELDWRKDETSLFADFATSCETIRGAKTLAGTTVGRASGSGRARWDGTALVALPDEAAFTLSLIDLISDHGSASDSALTLGFDAAQNGVRVDFVAELSDLERAQFAADGLRCTGQARWPGPSLARLPAEAALELALSGAKTEQASVSQANVNLGARNTEGVLVADLATAVHDFSLAEIQGVLAEFTGTAQWHPEDGFSLIDSGSLAASNVKVSGQTLSTAATYRAKKETLQLTGHLEGIGLTKLPWSGTVDPKTHHAAFAFPSLGAEELNPWLAGWDLGMTLRDGACTFSGAWEDGTLSGVAEFAKIAMQLHATGLQVDGISGQAQFSDLLAPRSKPGQRLQFEQMVLDDLTIAGGWFDWQLEGRESLLIEKANLGWCDGELLLAAVRVPLEGELTLDTDVRAERLDLGRLAALLPDYNASGSGRIYGRVPVGLDNGAIKIGRGFLYSVPGEQGRLSVQRQNLLTEGLSAQHPQYKTLLDAEAALSDFTYDFFRLEINEPEAPSPMQAKVFGRKSDQPHSQPYNVGVNLNANLEEILNLALKLNR